MQVQAFRAKDNSLHISNTDRVRRDIELTVAEKKIATRLAPSELMGLLAEVLTDSDMRSYARQFMTCIETEPKKVDPTKKDAK